jgi:hypothetical protein
VLCPYYRFRGRPHHGRGRSALPLRSGGLAAYWPHGAEGVLSRPFLNGAAALDLTGHTSARTSHCSSPWGRRRERLRQFWLIAIGQLFGAFHRPGTKINSIAESRCRAYIAAVFADRPDLAEALAPKYPLPGKRPVLTKDFYPASLRDDVELAPPTPPRL